MQHHLILLPLGGSLTAPEALRVIDRLEREGWLETVEAVVVERHADGSECIVEVRAPSNGSVLDLGAWRWLVDETRRGHHHDSGLTASFVAELCELLPTTDAWLAVVASRFDAGEAVAALVQFPSTRLVYGRLPEWTLARLHGRALLTPGG